MIFVSSDVYLSEFSGFITCFCPCITFGQIAEIVDKGSTCMHSYHINLILITWFFLQSFLLTWSYCCFTACAVQGTVYGALAMTGFACLYSCFYRSKMRGQYDLEESPCVDCLAHFFCEACALCQEYRELKIRGFDMGIGISIITSFNYP